jgi:Leu/Phe-tRNA-protein transferase
MPLSENPVPFQLAVETVTLEELALRVPLWFCLLPTATPGKVMVVGLTASCELLTGGGPGVLAIFAVAQPAPKSKPSTRAVVKPLALNVTTFHLRRALRRLMAQIAFTQNVDELFGRCYSYCFNSHPGPQRNRRATA